MGTFSIWHWLIVLIIVVLVFGTKKLRNLGGDLGGALKGFKDGMKEADISHSAASTTQQTDDRVIDVQAKRENVAQAFHDNIDKEKSMDKPASSVKTDYNTTVK